MNLPIRKKPKAWRPALPPAGNGSPYAPPVSSLEGISRRCVETRISLLKQPLGLHDPGFRFVFASEAGDRPGQAACRRHLDIERAVALRRYLECRDCHTREYAATMPQRNMSILTSRRIRAEYVAGRLHTLLRLRSWRWPVGAMLRCVSGPTVATDGPIVPLGSGG
jgi:hypothetical protein